VNVTQLCWTLFISVNSHPSNISRAFILNGPTLKIEGDPENPKIESTLNKRGPGILAKEEEGGATENKKEGRER